jgi:tetratricopeptide (TPR) repeat protein
MAMDDFQRAIDLDPEYVLAYVALAETIWWYRGLKQPEEAEVQALEGRARQALETALELDSESAAAISLLGALSDDRELAIQAYEHALEHDPNHAKSYHRLGWAVQKQRAGIRSGDLEETERLFRKALDLEPFNADWRSDLAELLYDLGRDEEAFAELSRSIELEPLYLFNHIKLGIWEYFDYGRLDEAMIHFREAYALDPEYGQAAWWVANSYADFGAREEALAWMERSIELSPTSAMTWAIAYQVYYFLGFEDEAMEYAVRSLELYPTTWGLQAVGAWDIREGRAEKALERWRLAYPLLATDHPVVEATHIRPVLYYAMILMDAGETGQAERLMNQCLDALDKWQNETFVRATVVLDFEQEIYAALGLKEETLAAVRTAIVDRQNYSGQWMYAFPPFDFIRDEPEFQELMAILHANLAQQYERISEMERNGELAPAPGVVLERQ